MIWLTVISFLTMATDYPIQWIAYVIYVLVYLSLEPLAMMLYLPIFHLLTLGGVHLPQYLPLSVILAIHVFSWAAQIYTHYAYEKRSPALKDNVVQALLMAPFFVWLEVLFMFNYRPAFQKELKIEIAKKISQLNQQKNK